MHKREITTDCEGTGCLYSFGGQSLSNGNPASWLSTNQIGLINNDSSAFTSFGIMQELKVTFMNYLTITRAPIFVEDLMKDEHTVFSLEADLLVFLG